MAEWKPEAERFEKELAEFGRPITPDHDHHEIRDWLVDAWLAGRMAGLEEAAKFLEQPAMVFAFDREDIRADVIQRIRLRLITDVSAEKETFNG